MSLTRRYFLKSAAAVGTTALTTQFLRAEEKKQSQSPNEKLRAAVIGTGGRGGGHISSLINRDDIDLLYLCDADTNHMGPKIKNIEAKTGRAPEAVQDYRRMLEDDRIDVVAIASPNHWHSLHAIHALQAGKHVYVEKPVSHNVWEGRELVNWARATRKLCQAGTQSRSSDSLKEAVKFVQEGKLGKIQYAIGTCYKPRKSIGKLEQPLQIPDSLDYDLWCGPADMVDLYRPSLHYDWHWDFNTGNGDMGNQGIHQMDIARWFLGESALAPRVISIGGRLGYEDAGDTPNTEVVYHGYEKAPLIFETRGLPQKGLDWKTGMDNYRGSTIGVIVQCEQGYVVVPSYTSATAYDNDGNEIQKWSTSGSADDRHFGNWIDAIRSGNRGDLNGEILQGHISSALCHTGSVSHRLGEVVPYKKIQDSVADNELLADSVERMGQHLAANGVDPLKASVRMGPFLTLNPETELFLDREDANQLAKRAGRTGYEIPTV